MLSLPTSLTRAPVCTIIRNLVYMTKNRELNIAYNSKTDIQILIDRKKCISKTLNTMKIEKIKLEQNCDHSP